MGRKFKGTIPEGRDQVVPARQVRHGMWMLDPETGEWANVKQAMQPRRLVCFGGAPPEPVVVLSLRRIGEREFGLDVPVTVRVPETAEVGSGS